MINSPTHNELVEAAARWLRRDHPVVVTELVSGAETPDAIGFKYWTTLIECKASRSDFLADKKKMVRDPRSLHAMGDYRYFLSPHGLIRPDEIYPKWGLIYLKGKKLRVAKKAELFEDRPLTASKEESGMLLSLLRRIGQTAPKGVSIKCYTFETRNTATLGVGVDPNYPEIPNSSEAEGPEGQGGIKRGCPCGGNLIVCLDKDVDNGRLFCEACGTFPDEAEGPEEA